jgi:phosphotransferase system enzyme I (PtsP)
MNRKDHDHLNLLCDIGDLAALLAGSDNIEDFLQNTVVMVSRHLNAEVGSIYLYDEQANELILKATIGLNPAAVEKVRMKIDEGLVGYTLNEMKPVCVGCAGHNPHFKYFEEADEDCFESFLSVPIYRGAEKIGVLVVQHSQQNYFDDIDVMALRAIASQLASAIENAKLLMNLRGHQSESARPDILKTLSFIKGKVGVKGFAFAPASVLRGSHTLMLNGDCSVNFATSLDDFYKAVRKTDHQLKDLQNRCIERLPESAALIFSAHAMILKDPKFLDNMVQRIKNGMEPAMAVRAVAQEYIELFSSSSHAYMREKVNDIKDLAGRILKNLVVSEGQDSDPREGQIVIAPELYPSDILKLVSENVQGIILVSGGITSHVTILSRSLQIPLIIADREELLDLPEKTPILIDAEIGNIYVNPSEEIVNRFENRNKLDKVAVSEMIPSSAITKTSDGVRVVLLANINLLTELPRARNLKAEGIGLYRTEFPFLIRTTFPSEEEQYQIYRRLFDEMCGHTVTFRTLDIGGEKAVAYDDKPDEANPELGLKSIRFALEHKEIFEQQIRAILRAGEGAETLRIMFPMISSLDDFREARKRLLDCMNSLQREKLPHHNSPEIGTMIEVPSVLGIIGELAREADFFSIGTNDFVQYMLAVDRSNERVAQYYCHEHPSVLRGLARIVEAALSEGKDVSICGEMAHESKFIPFLLGVGIRSLSVDPHFLLTVRKTIENLSIANAESHARKLLAETTIQGVRNILEHQSL